jgi:hypothetical protein
MNSLNLCQNYQIWGTRENYGPVGSNTDSGSKRGVYYKDITTMYLAFIITNIIMEFNIDE